MHPSPTSSKSRLRAFLIVGFLICVCLPVRFWLGPVQMTGLRLYLALLFLPFSVIALSTPSTRRDPVALLLAGFVLWGGIAISQTSPAHLVENTGAIGLEVFGAYLLAQICVRSVEDFRLVASTAGFLLFLIFPIIVWEAYSGDPIIIQAIDKLPGLGSVELVSITPRIGLERVQAVFAHPIHFGLFSSAIFALALYSHTGSAIRLVGLIILSIASVFLALSSGPLLALIVQISLVLWASTIGRGKQSWLTLLGVILICYVAVDLLSNRSPIRVFMSYATFSAHNAFWRGLIFEWGILNVLEHPVFGLGFQDWKRPEFMRSGSVDNFWLATAMKYGLPGLALLSAAVFLSVYRGVAIVKHTGSQAHFGWVIAMISLVLALCTVHVWTAIHAFVFFLLGCGQWTPTAARPVARASSRAVQPFSRSFLPSYVRKGATPWP